MHPFGQELIQNQSETAVHQSATRDGLHTSPQLRMNPLHGMSIFTETCGKVQMFIMGSVHRKFELSTVTCVIDLPCTRVRITVPVVILVLATALMLVAAQPDRHGLTALTTAMLGGLAVHHGRPSQMVSRKGRNPHGKA